MAMAQRQLETLEDRPLIRVCAEPALSMARKEGALWRPDALSDLTQGQKALLLFELLREHTVNGVAEFYSEAAEELRCGETWTALKWSMEYFGEEGMQQLLGEMEAVYNRYRKDGCNESGEMFSEFHSAVNRLDHWLYETMPYAVKAVGAYIRGHREEFVSLLD